MDGNYIYIIGGRKCTKKIYNVSFDSSDEEDEYEFEVNQGECWGDGYRFDVKEWTLTKICKVVPVPVYGHVDSPG